MSHNMLYHGAQRVKLPNLSKISRLLSPLAIFLRFQAFQRYMISDVVFWWKVDLNFGLSAATLCRPGVTIPRKRLETLKKTRKRPKKTLFSTEFCLYVTLILFYILVCVPNMYLQVYFT